MRTGAVILVVIFTAALATAQNASPTAPSLTAKSAHVRERVLTSNQERLSWEATQSASVAATQHRIDPAEHHSIHIDAISQPTLSAPKIRREWLMPAEETSKLPSEK